MNAEKTDLPQYTSPAYARFATRIKALLVDIVVVIGGVIAVGMFAAVLPQTTTRGVLLVVLMLSLVFLYEPLLVWRFGATVGHRAMNLRVVTDGTNANPDFGRALLRFWIKGLLGPLSFFTMALTRRHQAVHDRATSTTVQMRDMTVASPSDFVLEREIVESPGMPSKARRILVIVAYALGLFVATVITWGSFLSDTCALENRCSPGEELASNLLGLVLTGVLAVLIIFGWRGQLWGARVRPVDGAR
jgi:uncharacterized RDD family membrane protein YckC